MEEVSEVVTTKITRDTITISEEEDSTEAEDEEDTTTEEEVDTTTEVVITTNNSLTVILVKTTRLLNASSLNLLVSANSETSAHLLTEMNSSDKLLIIK